MAGRAEVGFGGESEVEKYYGGFGGEEAGCAERGRGVNDLEG